MSALEQLLELFNGGPDTAARTRYADDGMELWEVPAEDMRAVLQQAEKEVTPLKGKGARKFLPRVYEVETSVTKQKARVTVQVGVSDTPLSVSQINGVCEEILDGDVEGYERVFPEVTVADYKPGVNDIQRAMGQPKVDPTKAPQEWNFELAQGHAHMTRGFNSQDHFETLVWLGLALSRIQELELRADGLTPESISEAMADNGTTPPPGHISGTVSGEHVDAEMLGMTKKQHARTVGVHMSHCYQDDYAGTCKYGDDDCPAKNDTREPGPEPYPLADRLLWTCSTCFALLPSDHTLVEKHLQWHRDQ